MDVVILYIVSKVLKLRISPLRSIMGGIIGGCGACIIIIRRDLQSGFLGLSANLLICMLMIKVWLGIKTFRHRWNVVITLYAVTFVLGGLLTFICYNTNLLLYMNRIFGIDSKKSIPMYVLLLAIVIIVVTLPFIMTYINTFRSRVTNVFEVSIQLEEKSIVTKGLLDTGNHLHDPISGKPVIIIEKALIQTILSKELMDYTTRLKVIPFRSIGNDHGTMYGIVLDQISIQINDEKHEHKDVIACLYEGTLSANKDYQLILHEELLRSGHWS